MDGTVASQFTHLRAQAEHVVAQLGADSTSAAPLLAAIAALEQRVVHGRTSDAHDLAAALVQAKAEIATYRHILTEVPLGICMLDGPEHRYTFTNPSYEQLAGRSTIVGKVFREVFPEIAGQGIYEIIHRVYTTGEPFTTRELLVQMDRDGSGELKDAYFDLTYRPVRAANGTITGVITYVEDIGDRHALEAERSRVLELTQAAQETAEAERQRLLDLLRQAPAAICTLEGPDHIFTFTNPRYDQLVGQEPTQMIGRPIRTVLPEVEGQGYFELLDQAYATGAAFSANEEMAQLNSQGTGGLEQTFINFMCAPLRDVDGHITGIFAHIVDVTEGVKARQQAEAAVIVRDQFLSVAAHELKTPLTSLLGYMQLFQRRMRRAVDLDTYTDHTLTLLTAQTRRLSRLIDTLLDVARINMGHLSLECAPLDLAELTKRVIDEISVTLDRRQITATMPAAPCMILGDSLRLEQVIVNLLQNAVKYSPAGGEVHVTVACSPTGARMHIRDHGIGIPAAAMPHLFERYYRVAEGENRSIRGMGIGLSVVKEIVTLHHGTITVESTENQGSTFTMTLPLAEASENVGTA